MADRLVHRLLQDIRVILRLGPNGWLALLRATLELALARYRLGTRQPLQLLQRARQFNQPMRSAAPQASVITQRVAFVIPRVAARLPWRADCFIQAMAAQHWLQRKGIASALTIGTRKDQHGTFQAHAWLTCNEQVITGGDISGYVPLVTPHSELPR